MIPTSISKKFTDRSPEGQHIVFDDGTSAVVPWDKVNKCIRVNNAGNGGVVSSPSRSAWPYSSPPGRVPFMEQTWTAGEGMRQQQGLTMRASQGMSEETSASWNNLPQRPRQMQPPTSYNVTSSMDTNSSVLTSSSTTVEPRRRAPRKRSASNSSESDSITSALKLRWRSGTTGPIPIPRAAALGLKPPSSPAAPRVKGRPGLGTLWVNWGTESKRVPRDAVQPYLDAGWVLGRHWQPRNHNRPSAASTRKRRASAAQKKKPTKKTLLNKRVASPAEIVVPSPRGEFLQDDRGSFEDSRHVLPSQQWDGAPLRSRKFRRVEGISPPEEMPSLGGKSPSQNRNVVDTLNPWEAMEAVGGWLQEPQGRGMHPLRIKKDCDGNDMDEWLSYFRF